MLAPQGVTSYHSNRQDAWTLPIRIGMWTMYSVALILVIVVVMLNR